MLDVTKFVGDLHEYIQRAVSPIASRLKALEDRGCKLTAVQKDMLRWAMRPDDPTSRPLNSDFKPPPIESLPAAMRADLYPEHGQHQGENHE